MQRNFLSQYSGNEKISEYSTVHFDNLLGTGASGRVFDCTFSKGNISILACTKVMSRYQIPWEMLNKEISVLKMLQGEDNPNIVKIYEIVIREKDIFIVMQKCSEGDLNDLRKRRQDQKQSFTELEVKSLIRDIANAYKTCIKHGIIHRDIKPANILVHNNSYILTDFGMGRIINDVGKRLHMSRVGSPIFTAPQILHEGPYSIKCDVYSLGVVAFLLLYNTFPVNGRNEQDLSENLMQYRLRNFVCPENPDISSEMKRLIESMLQYDEERRIGWTELMNHKLLKWKIQVIETDLQVQVQAQPNQQPQPHNELLVTCIGFEPVDEDNMENFKLAPSNNPGPQKDLLPPEQPLPQIGLEQNQDNLQIYVPSQTPEQRLPSQQNPKNPIIQPAAYAVTQADLSRLFNFIEIFLAKVQVAHGTCKQIMANQQCISSLSQFELQALKTTLLGYSYQAALNANGMVHNVPQCIGSEMRELLSQTNNLQKFFFIMDAYSKQQVDHLSRQIGVVRQAIESVMPEYNTAIMDQCRIKEQCPARWSNFIPGLIEFTPGYHFFIAWFSAFYGEIQQKAHNFREQPTQFKTNQSLEFIRCIYLCHRFMKLEVEFPLAKHRIIDTSSITGMLQETSKELMINYILT